MLNMFTPFTHKGEILQINLVLWWKSSTIEIVPFNEEDCDPNEFAWRVQHRIQGVRTGLPPGGRPVLRFFD